MNSNPFSGLVVRFALAMVVLVAIAYILKVGL